MALEMTIPPAPAMPCSKRKNRNQPMVGESRQAAVERINSRRGAFPAVAVAERSDEQLPDS